jgi:Eukaryotic membrane protein family
MFTILPIRFVVAMMQLAFGRGGRHGRERGGTSTEGQDTAGRGPGGERPPPVSGAQLFDILCVSIFGLTAGFLQMVNAGSIYYWMKDLTREFLKLQVIHAVLEILDRVRLLPTRF